MLPWFANGRFPLYLAPMAGVTDVVFRQLCKELGADVMVTEFVSAEGILRRDERTRKYTDFTDEQRPVGVQLFGADGERMGEAARKIIEWKAPDFIDINFGCPVNKVVSKNGGSALLKDCPALACVASEVVKAVQPAGVPVTAKIRVGWDQLSINARAVVKILEESGVQAITIHGRTRAQGYSGNADWAVIGECAASARVPIIGNGDITSGADVEKRRTETKVAGVMIGRAAMGNPWIFQEAKRYIHTGEQPPSVALSTRWELILRHARLSVLSGRYGNESQTMHHMRGRLMAYASGFAGAKKLRQRFTTVTSITELEDMAAAFLANAEREMPELAIAQVRA
ncbi:MAG: tRNA dihydrouridine synthase DusB [Verrucomicrobiales bacterium]